MLTSSDRFKMCSYDSAMLDFVEHRCISLREDEIYYQVCSVALLLFDSRTVYSVYFVGHSGCIMPGRAAEYKHFLILLNLCQLSCRRSGGAK